MHFTIRRSLLLLATLNTLALGTPNAAEVLPRDSNAIEKRAEDCDFASWQWADVDCYYDFDRGGNFLNYVIRIEPTGQENTQGWCKGIVDNIIGDCGRRVDVDGCGDYLTYNLHHPKTHQVKSSIGIDMNYHWYWPWQEGEDMVTCMTSAIVKATCHSGISFKNGKCYKRGDV